MDSIEVAVSILIVAIIGFILWWFFGTRVGVNASTKTNSGFQEIEILVKGGYSPDRVTVKRGMPVRLKFNRQETSSCSEQLIISDFGIAQDLPAFQTTPVEFTPQKTGSYEFTCGMNMLRGRIMVLE